MGSTGPQSSVIDLTDDNDVMPEVSTREELGSSRRFLDPEINNIKDESKLKCFNKNMIIMGELHCHPLLDLYLDNNNLNHAIDQIYRKTSAAKPSLNNNLISKPGEYHLKDMCAVFYLMSILPQQEATKCKKLLDKIDKNLWCPTLFNVLLVLANWGVSLELLGVEKHAERFYSQNLPQNDLKPPKSCNFEMAEESAKKIKGLALLLSKFVYLIQVLQMISSKMSPGAMDDGNKIRLIVCLTKVSLEREMESVKSGFWEAIQVVMDSITDWSEDKANSILKQLKVATINIDVAYLIFHNVFYNRISERCMAVSRLGVQGLIVRLYTEADLKLQTPENLLDNLPSPSLLEERLDMDQLTVLILLIQTHMDIQTYSGFPIGKDTLKDVWEFTRQLQYSMPQDVSNECKQLSYVLSRVGGHAMSERRQLYNVGIVETQVVEHADTGSVG